MRTVVLIPYYGGITPAANPPSKRPGYLAKTVKSLQGLADIIWVGVCRPEDEYQAVRAGDVIAARFDCAPLAIAHNLLKMAQEDGFTEGYDLVYVTEADQILHYDPEIISYVQGRDYLVPHRLEELGPNRAGAERGPLFSYDGREWVTGERPPIPVTSQPVYSTAHIVDGYGGAYLCSAEFFRAMNIQLDQQAPVENATGFTPFHQGRVLKATDWQRFFVEHLSGHDYHCKLAEGR